MHIFDIKKKKRKKEEKKTFCKKKGSWKRVRGSNVCIRNRLRDDKDIEEK